MPRIFAPRNIAVFGACAGIAYVLAKRSGAMDTPMQTPAVKSIGDRWSAGGGSDVHTPGVATQRGNSDSTHTTQHNPRGINSKHFGENVADQKAQQPGAMGKKWNETHYGPGAEKGK